MLCLRSHLGLIFLSLVYFCLLLLAWACHSVQIVIIDFAPIVLKLNNGQFPLMIGTISVGLVLLSLALIVLDLVNEFFRFRLVFFLIVGSAITLGLIDFFLFALPYLPLIENVDSFIAIRQTVLNSNFKSLIRFMTTITAGFFVVSLLFHILRKLAKGGFDLLRLFISHSLGLALLSAGLIYLDLYSAFDQNRFLVLFFTDYFQWFLVSLLFYPLYYIMKLPTLILTGGTYYQEINHSFAGNSKKKFHFKPEEEDVVTDDKKSEIS